MKPWDDPERLGRLKLNGEKREAKDVDNVAKPSEQIPLFKAIFYDVQPKDDRHTMEHPFFAVAKQPDKKIRTFTDSSGRKTTIVPSHTGLATMYDKDLLLFVVSHLMHAKNHNEPTSKGVRIVSHDFLEFAKRGDGGQQYRKLIPALDRLLGTSIKTEIETNDTLITKAFGWIDGYEVLAGKDGKLLEFSVTLPQWVYNAIIGDEVLSIERDYFDLPPFERRLYEVVRKHLGKQTTWNIELAKLKAKVVGDTGENYEFARNLKRVQESANGLLGYTISLRGRGKAQVVEFEKPGRNTESTPKGLKGH